MTNWIDEKIRSNKQNIKHNKEWIKSDLSHEYDFKEIEFTYDKNLGYHIKVNGNNLKISDVKSSTWKNLMSYFNEMNESQELLNILENYDKYWRERMDQRMNFKDEVTRMQNVLQGFYLEDCMYYKKQPSECGLIYFHDSKRPYGSKAIECSIAFNLGWDKDRILCHVDLPEWVKEEAWKIHEAVLENLKKDLEEEEC